MIGLGLIKVVAMGIVQGLSEFLPVSSSGHLVFTSHLIQMISHNPILEDSSYDIVLSMMLHIGTLVAVLIFFKNEVLEIWNALINGIKNKDYTDYNCKLGLYIILGTMITVFVALIFDNAAERLMDSPAVVGVLLIVTGGVLLGSEKYSDSLKEKSGKVSLKTAIIMSVAQGLAALPGFSRSGWTIAAGMFSKTERVACARYSFLLSIPIILGASIVYPLKEINMTELVSYNWIYILIGTVVSAVVGYICIKYFLEFLGKYSLRVFAYYCFAAGFIASILFTFI
ncbi:MAG: undecaprenyl-diphosphate phosphatase [Candidatus Gastranaerophilales bacterium]|nr:undecaprenyl-diphosphate phosphatase [Candidatus Gastranaerophilales bacterium]